MPELNKCNFLRDAVSCHWRARVGTKKDFEAAYPVREEAVGPHVFTQLGGIF